MLIEQLIEGRGYHTGFRLSDGEASAIKTAIKDHLCQGVKALVAPELVSVFENTPLENYHTISDRLPHDQILTRAQRILPKTVSDMLHASAVVRAIESEIGPCAFSDEEGVGRPNLSLRMVRPGVKTDVGSLHADHWFWPLYGFPIPDGKWRVKVWIAINTEPGQSGLLLSPHSHKRAWRYDAVPGKGGPKPLLDPAENPELDLFRSEPGDAVVFNYHLLHGGKPTTGSTTRVSVEFTLLASADRLLDRYQDAQKYL